jgi:hypothetical protein
VTDPNLYQKARTDVAIMLGYDLDALTPEQSMRVDVASALRVLLDTQTGRLLRGESLDAREMLMASEALSRILPPSALASPPAEEHGDPRVKMFEIYMEMRTRGEVPDVYWHQHHINALEAENAELKARLGLAPALTPFDHQMSRQRDISPPGGSSAITPREADITPPSELGSDCYAGMRPGLDDPPKTPPVIDVRSNPPAAPQQSAKRTPAKPAWQDWLDSGGAGGPGYDRWADNR